MFRPQDRRDGFAPRLYAFILCPKCFNLHRADHKKSCCQPVRRFTDDHTRYCSPSPNDNWLIDNLVFKCQNCGAEMDYNLARTHPNTCAKRPTTFKPPNYIFDWNDIELTLRQTISNPIVGEPETRKDRLLIYHHNGVQLSSKFINANWDIARVKQQIGRLTDSDATEIRIFKFSYEELHSDTKVTDVATKLGVTHITSLTGLRRLHELASSTAIISLHDIEPGPRVARPFGGSRGRDQI